MSPPGVCVDIGFSRATAERWSVSRHPSRLVFRRTLRADAPARGSRRRRRAWSTPRGMSMTRSIATGARASPLCRLPSVAPAAASGCLFPRGFRRAGRRPPRGIARSTLALAARADIPRVGPGGCFVDHCDARVSGAPSGPLAGLTFAAKDNLDVLGSASGCAIPPARDPPRPRPRARSRRRRPPQRRRLARREDPDGRARGRSRAKTRTTAPRRIQPRRVASRAGRRRVPPSPSPRDSATSPSARTPRAASASPRGTAASSVSDPPTELSVSRGASRWRRRSTSSVCSPPSPAR